MKTKLHLLIVALAASFSVHAQNTIYVGGDISQLQSYEDNNVAYYDQQGKKIDDVLKYMKSEAVGWNALRVRLFVNPTKQHPNGAADPQVCQDIDYVVRLAKRIKAEGFAFMLDFHYSDTWADPSNQWTPAAWKALNDNDLYERIYSYTKECLEKLVEAGATPDFIQTGNEISYGMLWGAYGSSSLKQCFSASAEANWTRFKTLLSQAAKACREVCPQAKIIIHTERAGKPQYTVDLYKRLAAVDYDVIGLSYYPFWHGGLATLGNTLNMLAQNLPEKTVQIVETAYYYQYQPAASSSFTDFSSVWAVSPDGQAAFASSLIDELKNHTNVNGLYWWFPEENGNGPRNVVLKDWVNRGLWNNTTHRAHPGLYVLKDYLPADAGIGGSQLSAPDAPGAWYNLNGQRLSEQPAKSGIYLHEGRKVIIRPIR
ncbi:MAG: arabinogalactan endo-1,4-beta-galactosidase [Prevotella sp.]|nr:arabinogalactan endo-1,4-beta-galactosidase [Prevotella sp.]